MNPKKQQILDEYIVTRGGTTINVPIDDREFETAWNITTRKVTANKLIQKSIAVTLTSGLTLPDDGNDFYMFVPQSAEDIFEDMDYVSTEYQNVNSYENGLRAIYMREDLRNMVDWIISAKYDRVTNQIIIDNYAGHQGEPALMLYELKEEFFDISFIVNQERVWFIDYLYGILDVIIGYKFRRAGVEEGESFLSDGKEAKDKLEEELGATFISPTLLFA